MSVSNDICFVFCLKFSDKLLISITLCILMDFPIPIDMISMGLSISYFKGSQLEVSKLMMCFCS